MHIDSSTYTTPDGRTYTRHLLRESYRSGGKVLKRTLANLSHLEPERLEALRLALAHKGPVCELANVSVGLEELKELCTTQVWVRGRLAFTAVPQPRDSTQALLAAAGIDLSAMLPRVGRLGAAANTRRKLPSQRRERRSRKATVDTNGSSTAEP